MKIVWGRSIGFNIDLYKARMSYNGAAKWNPSPGKVYMEKQVITDGAGCYPWRKTFAWWPWTTTITGHRVWWKTIYKRRVWVVWGTGFHMEPEVEYATLFEILASETKT
jgi:hypothetical protein